MFGNICPLTFVFTTFDTINSDLSVIQYVDVHGELGGSFRLVLIAELARQDDSEEEVRFSLQKVVFRLVFGHRRNCLLRLQTARQLEQ